MESNEELKKPVNRKPIVITAVIAAVVCIAVVIVIFAKGGSTEKSLAEQLDLAERYLSELDYESAIAAYEAAIRIDPKSEDAYRGLADAYIGLEDYQAAVEALERGIDQSGSENLAEYLAEISTKYLLEERAENGLSEKTEVDGEAAENGEEKAAEITDAEQIQVTITRTKIQADSVFNQEGYGSLTINGVGSLWDNWDNPESVIPPQKALIDADGNFVFPYKSTYLTYYISEGVVSLTESSAYFTSDNYELGEYLPAYYNLDGSSVFVPEVTVNGIDRDEDGDEYKYNITWYGGPMQDGYALVIEDVERWYPGAFGGMGINSYIMDKSGTITCTLPEEFNDCLTMSGNWGIRTIYSLGWCGEGLFAVFDHGYDENGNYSGEAKGYMDPAGNMVLDLSGHGFTDLWPFHEGLAAVRSESGLIGFIDKTGALVIPCIYDATGDFCEDGICAVKIDGKWGYIDKDGSEIIPFEYDNAYGAGNGLASVVKDGMCGLVDYSNQVIVPLEYDDISSCEGGTAYAIKDGEIYIITMLVGN